MMLDCGEREQGQARMAETLSIADLLVMRIWSIEDALDVGRALLVWDSRLMLCRVEVAVIVQLHPGAK